MNSALRKILRAVVRAETAIGLLVVGAGIGALVGIRLREGTTEEIAAVQTTVADLRSLHAEVLAAGKEVQGDARLLDGDTVKTGAQGRAQVRLDDGTLVIVDGNAELTLHGARIALARGRIFVQAGSASRTEVALSDVIVTVVSSAAAFDAQDASVYCARGEIVIAAGGKAVHAASGETAKIGKDGAKVAPETAFDDWTGGLAVPWSGERGPASAIAELWGGDGATDPGSPLVVRTEKVDVTVEGEVAVTRMRTTYFNGSDRQVRADVRMALPEGAIITRFARQREDETVATEATLGAAPRVPNALGTQLEWAGGGWLRGHVDGIGAGKSVDVMIDYVEWLTEKNGRATYRFPMASDRESPMVGALDVDVSSRSPAKWLSASTGAVISGGAIELRKADVRPTGDLVVEMVPSVIHAGNARAYVEQGDAHEDPYVLVRTELPEQTESGVTLALVVDSSSSVGPALLETERAAVDALLDAMGPKDSVVVLAADQGSVIVGPDKPSSVTPDLRARVRKELGAIRSGGASNLGLALERAADLLDAQAGAGGGMVVYLGDGRPTVGESDARELRQRLARRAGGVPRLGALAIGQAADRWMLAELVAGGGPVYDVLDRPDAARAASALVADALAPTLRDVSIALGPTVDRVYPRDARALLAGSTVTVSGRLRGELPKEIALRYRKGTELVEEIRPLELVTAPSMADVSRRWAQQRIEESVTHADGLEPAIALATAAKLLTPWNAWTMNGAQATPFEDRLLGLSAAYDTAFASRVDPAPRPPSLLLEPPVVFDGEASIEEAAEIAARHSIEQSMPALVACRDARASIKPGLGDDVHVEVTVAADGKATKVTVRAARGDDDVVLDRCLRVVVSAVPFFGPGVAISFAYDLALPPGQTSQRTQCSVASTLPLPVRRGIWRARKAKNQLDYHAAAHACELPTWGDRRTLLGIIVGNDMSVENGISLARGLATEGDTDAAAFVRQQLLLTTNQTRLGDYQLRQLLIGDEPKVDRALDKAYRAARTDDARMTVVRRFLRLAPHSPLGRRLYLSTLEAKNDRAGLLDAIEHVRGDVFADAGLLAECASALRRLGMDQEGRRAFGDLIERAPRDPWTLGYVGDRLRAEGLYEEALAAYTRLDAAMPDDPAVAVRLALAHAGAGRLDVATRLLDRASQTGGRGDDGRLGELASVVEASLLATARQAKPSPSAETDALLVRRLAQTPLPDVSSIILVRTPLTDDKVEVTVARRVKDKDELPADLDASSMGLSAVRMERGGGTARIRLKRSGAMTNGRPTRGLVTALVLGLGNDRGQARLVTREVDVAPGDKGTELRWNGESFE